MEAARELLRRSSWHQSVSRASHRHCSDVTLSGADWLSEIVDGTCRPQLSDQPEHHRNGGDRAGQLRLRAQHRDIGQAVPAPRGRDLSGPRALVTTPRGEASHRMLLTTAELVCSVETLAKEIETTPVCEVCFCEP